MDTNQISVTDTVASLIASSTSRKSLLIRNTGSKTIYIGNDNSVTDNTGFPILAGKDFKDTSYNGAYYVICATGETSIAIIISEE